MKRNIYIILVLSIGIVFTIVYVNVKPGKQSIVTIKGEGFSEEFKNVTLKYYDHNTLAYLELESKELTADDGFEFAFPFENENLYELNFDEKEFIPISVETAKPICVKRTGKVNKIEGPESAKSITLFREQNERLQAKYFGQLKADYDKAMTEDDEEKIEELNRQSEILIEEYLIDFREVITDLGTTPAAYYALQFSDFNKELNFIESRLLAFKQEAPKSMVTKALERQVYKAKATSIGNVPPQFKAETIAGELVSLSDYKGKVLLIDFWASWCRACRIENPKFIDLYEKYKAIGFDIISISQDLNAEQWANSIENDGIKAWTHILDKDNSISDLYCVSSLPQNLLLDVSGTIIAKNITAEELASRLSSL